MSRRKLKPIFGESASGGIPTFRISFRPIDPSSLDGVMMGFRKDTEAAREWKQWVARCRPALLECGVPLEAFDTQRRWWYFLDHGSLSNGKAPHWFSLDQLSSPQVQRLLTFLETEYGLEKYPPCLLTVVRSRLGLLPRNEL